MPKKPKDFEEPLPLEELRAWIQSDETYGWLEEGDAKAAALQAELEAEGADQIAGLFGNDDDDDSDDSDRSDADFEGFCGRVRVWNSSRTNLNGVGARFRGPESPPKEGEVDEGSVRIVYLISESWEGYGDLLWASSRHLANQFADPVQCRTLLGPLWEARGEPPTTQHPLQGLRLLELGAGCGVPSLVAMKRGARVVCTDLDNPNRIRCIAEGMERNHREMDPQQHANASLARACPFRWGNSTRPVAEALNQSKSNPGDDKSSTNERFDVVCATDCLFMPWLHYDLIAGIDELLEPNGVAILAFAIHEAFSKDHEVWPFVDKAKEKGFDVEILPAVQLTPPSKGMDPKQGLVNKLRLTKNRSEAV